MWRFKEREKNFLGAALLSVLLFGTTFCLWLTALTNLEFSTLAVPLAVGTLAAITCCAGAGTRREWLIPAIWLAAVLLAVVVLHGPFMGGIAQLLNDGIDTWAQVHLANYPLFAGATEGGELWALLPLAVVLALGCQWAVQRRGMVMPVAAVASLVVICALFLPVLTPLWLAGAALTALLWTALGRSRGGAVQYGLTLRLWLRTALPVLLVTGVLWLALGVEGKSAPICSLAQWTEDTVTELRYGSYQGTGLTGGKVADAGPRVTGGEESMLRVTMTEPTSYYLRGFVGDSYHDGRWEQLDRERLYENRAVFGALHQNGFYPQCQLSAGAAALGEEHIRYENTVQVENLGLPGQYLYTPYEMLTTSPVLQPGSVGDSALCAPGCRGQKDYTMLAANNLVVQYQKLSNLLYGHASEDAVAAFLQQEAAYNQFVYQNDRDIPPEIDAFLSEVLGNYEIAQGQVHFDYQKAKQNILYYLTTYMVYNEQAEKTPEDVDFVLHFLEGSRAGYSIHFASAAVMMFRYYGIPARFAEGYLVTKAEAEAMELGQPLELDSSHAHAWVEYYQDGVGWLPFEVTPSHLSVMEQPDVYQPITGLIGKLPDTETEETLQPDDLEEEEPSALLAFWLKNRLTILLILGALALAGLVVLFLSWLAYERRKTARRKAGFLSEDLHSAICSIFEYMADVLVAAGLTPQNRSAQEESDWLEEDLRPEFRAVVDIWQEAKFSDNPMTEAQRRRAIALKDQVWERVWSQSGWLKKLQLKYLYFL